MPTLAGPPAGKVPLVWCPSVCTAQLAGAMSSSPSTAARIATRTRATLATASATIAPDPSTISTVGSHVSEPCELCRTASSVATPAATAIGARTRICLPPRASCAAPAPTRPAVNGAMSET